MGHYHKLHLSSIDALFNGC